MSADERSAVHGQCIQPAPVKGGDAPVEPYIMGRREIGGNWRGVKVAKPLTLKAPENRKPGRTRRERPDGLLPGLYSRLAIYLPARKAAWR